MAEEEKKPEQPEKPTDDASVDGEVADLLSDMIALLCNAIDSEVKVTPVRGDKSAMFVVDLAKPRYRGMLIGREGRTIMAIRQYLKAVGGAYRRYYDIDLSEDRERPHRRTAPPRGA